LRVADDHQPEVADVALRRMKDAWLLNTGAPLKAIGQTAPFSCSTSAGA